MVDGGWWMVDGWMDGGGGGGMFSYFPYFHPPSIRFDSIFFQSIIFETSAKCRKNCRAAVFDTIDCKNTWFWFDFDAN